jgi:hypothetical protein
MQVVSRDVIRLLSQFRVIFQITALERSDTLDRSRSLHASPPVVLRHVIAQGVLGRLHLRHSATPGPAVQLHLARRMNCLRTRKLIAGHG